MWVRGGNGGGLLSLGGSLGASGACRTCEDCVPSPEDSFRLTLGGRGGGIGGGILCAFGTLTCGEMGIGPKSPLLLPMVVVVPAFRIIESAVVEEALLLLKVDDWYDVDSEGDAALALLL